MCYALGFFHFRLCGFGVVSLGFRASAGGLSCLWSNVVVAFFLWVCVCVCARVQTWVCMHARVFLQVVNADLCSSYNLIL